MDVINLYNQHSSIYLIFMLSFVLSFGLYLIQLYQLINKITMIEINTIFVFLLFLLVTNLANDVIKLFFKKYNLKKYLDLVENIKIIESNNDSHLIFILDDTWNKCLDKLPDEVTNRIIDIDDEEKFIEWISNKFSSKKLLQIVIYTNGGSISSSDSIFKTLLRYNGEKRIYIPFYAYSAGSMIALAADKIFMNKYSYLGPVDPQIPYGENDNDECSSNILIRLLSEKDKNNISDKVLISAFDASSFHSDNIENLNLIFKTKEISEINTKILIDEFGSGKYPHHKQFFPNILRKFGLNISTRMPLKINEIFHKLLEAKKCMGNHFSFIYG